MLSNVKMSLYQKLSEIDKRPCGR